MKKTGMTPGMTQVALVLASLLGACSSSGGSGPVYDLGPASDQAGFDLAPGGDTVMRPDHSPWLGCNNSGGERLDNGCFFDWSCPNGVDLRVTCTAGAGGFDCVCADVNGVERGRFTDAESCRRSAQEIAGLANASCGWQLAEGR